MTRGRKRKHEPTIPGHIDQKKIPKGIYWDRRDKVWYTIQHTPKARRQRVTGPNALLSELHKISEELSGVNKKSLAWLLEQFHGSRQFKELAARTQANYTYLARITKATTTAIGPLGTLDVARMTPEFWQRLVDRIANDTPTQANQILRYVRRVFRWGVNRGHCNHNPAQGVEQAKERQQRRLPAAEVYARVLQFAQARGERAAHSEGSVAPYLWIAMELAYLLRLRGIEVITLTDANASQEGVTTNRRKGSRDNVVRWSPRLRSVWDAAVAYRKQAVTKHARPTPLLPRDHFLLVSQKGTPLRKSSLDTAWQRLMITAMREGILTAEQRFSLHDLKRKGITDTPGTRADKQLASGHRDQSMLDVYDLSLPVVDPSVPD
ncbi:integrase [Dyella sp. M7H15-1]|uniref:site-specific integrase n=1 Tax=Dyella sp. M7H15-1 TaxID=2501295 RepID=UPI001004FA8C|nr:integrase [Dyella sp. M7H15-1]QAU22852.1 integrase [Dyella sp. M7H15-1]